MNRATVDKQAPLASKWIEQEPYLIALEVYHSLNWAVLPGYATQTNNKKPYVAWKEFQQKAADEATIEAWEKEHHPELWLTVTGQRAGIIVLDYDGEDGRKLVEKYGLTPHVRTGSGGFQQYFKHPGWRVKTVNNKSSKDQPWAKQYPGLDIRADGGLAVIAGKNRKGKYTWLRDPVPDDLSILPEEMREALGLLHAPQGEKRKSAAGRVKQASSFLEEALHRVEQEGRNDVGFWLARTLRRSGISREQAEKVMREYQSRVPPTNAKGEAEEYTIEEALASLTSAYGNKPLIVLGKQLDEEIDEILEALYAVNDPPVIFIRGGCLARVCINEKQRPSIETMTDHMLLAHITKAANFLHYSEATDSYTNAHPSAKHANLVLAQGQWDFPALEGITEVPIIRKDGTILDKPGYDPTSRLIYLPHPDLAIPPIPSNPTRQEIEQARDFAFGFISEFPYVSQADRANAYGLLLTVVTRILYDLAPLALLNATKPGTGKTLLFKVIAWLLTGRVIGTTTMPGSEEEWGKTLTGLLLAGTVSAFCIDNIEQVLKSGKFSSFLTTPGWKERVLGSNAMPELEQRTIPMATGNNIMLGGDIPRRCYRITLDAGISTPWQRDNFTYVPLIDHIRVNRGKIIAALLTLVRAWYVEGQPKPKKKVAFQDDFAEWARITSGVLAFAGIDGFLENLTDMYEKADVDGNAWALFLETWYAKLGKEAYTTKQLIEKLSMDAEFADTLPDPLGTWFQEESKSLSRKIGKALAKKNGTPFGRANLRIVQGEDTHSKLATFKVAGFAGFAGKDSPQRGTEPMHQYTDVIEETEEKCNGVEQTPQTPQNADDSQNGHHLQVDPLDRDKAELLTLGQQLGYPALDYRPGTTLGAGEDAWRKALRSVARDRLVEMIVCAAGMIPQESEVH